MKNVLVVSLLVGLLFLCVASGGLSATESITIQGSTTVNPISQVTAEAFMDGNPGMNISIRGGGSGTGIAALIDNTVELAQSSRFIAFSEVLRAVENEVYPVPHRIGMDGIAVVVHPSNPIDELSLDELQSIFSGEIKNWSELGGKDQEIILVSRDSASGTFGVFNSIVLRERRLAPESLTQASNAAISSTVSQTPGGIGYVGLGYLTQELKAVGVDGILPTNASVSSGEYPIARPLFFFTNGWPEGVIASYLGFVLSEEGQKLVEDEGFVPLF